MTPAASRCRIVIPAKQRKAAKQRLAPALSQVARERLVTAMLAHVVETAGNARCAADLVIVGDASGVIPGAVRVLADPGGGLNAALAAGLTDAVSEAERAGRLVVLPADLPLLTVDDVERLVDTPNGSIAIAPDRHGTGTNALSLPLPEAAGFAFRFGDGSFALHCAEARRLGLGVEIVRGDGLERDVDTPADLADTAMISPCAALDTRPASWASAGPATEEG